MGDGDWLERICVVLVRARNPANIGAVARAMHDFGFGTLRVVNEFMPPLEAAKSAVDASAVMENATSFASVAEAVADCSLVVGTTAVGERDLQHPLRTLADAGPVIHAGLARMGAAQNDGRQTGVARVALVFGSEKTGLSNEEMSHCNWLLTIPMYAHEGVRHPSMNLGQAVAVCLYELVRTGGITARRANVDAETAPADAAMMERMTELLLELMEKTEYTRRHAASAGPEQVRRLVRRMGLDAEDASVWMGILRQARWKLGEREE